MDVSIVIVNWNSIEFLTKCVESIYATTHRLSYEIVVVDNSSADDFTAFSQRYPQVKVVQAGRNLGFAGANNLGTEHTSGDKILYLNPDTLVTGNAIEQMAARLDAPEVGAVGCRLLNGDMTLQMSAVQPYPTIVNQLLTLDYFKRRWPMFPLWGMRALYAPDSPAANEVEVISGACLMVKRAVLEKVGVFSTEYFMYAEEIDLCYRIRRAGWVLSYLGDAEVVHFGGQSTKKKGDGFADVMMRDSVFKFLRKFRGKTYAACYRGAMFFSAIARLIVLGPLVVVRGMLRGGDDVARAFNKWRKIATWSLALQSWTHTVARARTTAVKS